jgi:hypothetical protein
MQEVQDEEFDRWSRCNFGYKRLFSYKMWSRQDPRASKPLIRGHLI